MADAASASVRAVSGVSDEAHPGEAVMRIGLLTGGQDPHYSHGLALALADRRVHVDFVGSDELDGPALRASHGVRFLNLRGSQDRKVSRLEKVRRVVLYYGRLLRFAASSEPKILHILWNNKIELFDRTLLMLYYRLCGHKLALTAHNVNAARRDGRDNLLNRLSLRAQYRCCDQIFVHTPKMQTELIEQFGVSADRITIIPYGINNVVPERTLTSAQARRDLAIAPREKTILFFGQIASYKGVDILAKAFDELLKRDPDYRLVIAGQPKPGADAFWRGVLTELSPHVQRGKVTLDIRHIPDGETERYFMAADVLVLPYRDIFQSGVLFLGYRFGLPVVAANVGSLHGDVVEGRTGFVCPPENPHELAKAISQYFKSRLFEQLASTRADIRDYMETGHSWTTVARLTSERYARIAGGERGGTKLPAPGTPNSSSGQKRSRPA